MPQFKFSDEELAALIAPLRSALIKAIREDIHAEKNLPILLTRKQFMELTGVSETKCWELFNRPDFPVTREFGRPKVPTKMLYEWIYRNTQNARSVNYPFNVG